MKKTQKKIVLTLVNVWKIQNHTPHFGLTSLAAYVRINHPNLIIKIVEGLDPLDEILKTKPDIVGFSSDTFAFNRTSETATEIKKHYNIPIIIGGVHITALPDSFSQPFDIGVIGEGELTLDELIELYTKKRKFNFADLQKINGLILEKDGKLVKTAPRQVIKNIDDLPFPARDLTPMEDVYLKNQINLFKVNRMASIMTTRGCPYHCVFCGSPVQWSNTRFHSPEYIIKEIKFLIKEYNIDSIMFWDDLYIAPLDRLEKIKDLILKEKLNEKLVFVGYARANLITEKVCQTLVQMNTKRLIFGLESASPKILDYLKQKSVTVEDNRRAVTLCRKYGLTTSSGYIVGTPGETIEDVKMTYEFMKKYPLDNTQIYILTPYPGTKIWFDAAKENIVSTHMNFDKLFVQLPEISILDYFRKKSDVLKNRIFLNKEYRENEVYLDYIFKIRKLANIQNYSFYFRTISLQLDVLYKIFKYKFLKK